MRYLFDTNLVGVFDTYDSRWLGWEALPLDYKTITFYVDADTLSEALLKLPLDRVTRRELINGKRLTGTFVS